MSVSAHPQPNITGNDPVQKMNSHSPYNIIIVQVLIIKNPDV